ncbi:hypothetical protein HF086_007388 [Spodoptera exigua]|uniref:GBF1-like tetratricopeptide repeats domain-containing protein n=1 Tax=Spodoptera exigua TaxID=7107 RepID=A0A922SGP1_SPOEX|nr:hypothetical protein HF086_007388 [Spodoptera exigua]
MHTLHNFVLFVDAEEYDLWEVAWKPLLQGIAQFCTDRRKQVSNSAVAYLQRALLAPGLAGMGGARWEAAFHHVLFPLLELLPRRADVTARAHTIMSLTYHASLTLGGRLPPRAVPPARATAAPRRRHRQGAHHHVQGTTISYITMQGMGGARWEAAFHHVLFPLLELLPRRADVTARAHTIMCKVFLQHLSALSARASFGALWVRVLDRARALLLPEPDDPLTEAALESLKNMILVMDSVRIFSNADGYNDLWYITWDKINEFLPNLKEELFPQVKDNAKPTSLPSHMQPSLPPSLPTLVPVQQTSTPTLVPIPSAPQPIPPQSPQIQSPMLAQNLAHSPVNLVQTPPLVANAPTLVAPTPISGMVPIRNPLYDQTGLTSSVLLQPLNEMISTPIGMSMQPQMPMLYPQNVDPTPTRPDLIRMDLRPDLTPQVPTRPENPYLDPSQPDITRADPHVINVSYNDPVLPETKVEQSELYADYLTNPYTEIKDISKEATLYDPEDPKPPPNDIKNPLLSALDKKSYSANATPMHTVNKAQFGSSDNVRQESGIFNFSSYFGSASEAIGPGSEVFDTLMSTQEG